MSGQDAVAEILLAREPAYSQDGRRLNKRDAHMQRHLAEQLPNAESNAMAQDMNPANLTELLREIDRHRPGSKQRDILEQELARIKDQMSNLLGPINPEPVPMGPRPGFQNMPFDPKTQGGFMSPQTPLVRPKYGY